MNYLSNLFHLTELEWIAIGSIGTFLLAIAAFYTIFLQRKDFEKLRADENERNFKNSSIALITKFDKDFDKIEDYRFDLCDLLIKKHILDSDKIDFKLIEYWIGYIFDFFDTLGFFVKEEYIKAEVAHQYFYHWFSNYYEFYKLYDIKKISGYPETTWINLLTLSNRLDDIEVKQSGRKRQTISKAMLQKFFEEETLDED